MENIMNNRRLFFRDISRVNKSKFTRQRIVLYIYVTIRLTK